MGNMALSLHLADTAGTYYLPVSPSYFLFVYLLCGGDNKLPIDIPMWKSMKCDEGLPVFLLDTLWFQQDDE